MSQLKIAHMASFPDREQAMLDAVESIFNQVDYLFLYLNEYEQIPKSLIDKYGSSIIKEGERYCQFRPIRVFLGREWQGDLKDNGKFFAVNTVPGYQIVVDDDLIYPPDFVQRIIKGIHRVNEPVAVSAHGRIIQKPPFDSYYRAKLKLFHCLREVGAYYFANILGTGVLGFHSDEIGFTFSDVGRPYMTDIWFAAYCHENQIPRIVIPHDTGWIKHSDKFDRQETIYGWFEGRDQHQTKVANRYDWDIPVVSFTD